MKYPLKWSKKEILERVKSYDNNTLLQETIDLGAGDSYDGCFTNKGQFEYDALLNELNERLVKIGFITITAQ